MIDYEKLGVFYLGKEFDLETHKINENLVLYDSKDLLTHALAVGMTGSGKTGLCIGVIEEAAIDNIPTILIDPKGDLTNLLLNFPNLQPEEFLPWVNPDDANKKNLTLENHAKAQAALWEKGLGEWGQTKERISKLRNAVDMVIYTPGSTAGKQVSILKTLSAPAADLVEDGELFQEKVSSTVSSILGLINIDADPINSREHILLSTIFSDMWRQGKDVDLPILIGAIQKPPFKKIGVLDLESFYPEKERFSLMMALNNLIASPGFAAWLEGDALEIGDILYARNGKPRVAIFSIAHLNDNERMFFVSLLLNQVLGWVRGQSGTTSLRALLYMDEIFGYFPPVANPPSKKPLLSLLKQARAFGLGLVLSTQNPVDIDYKGLSNIGTWFIGRLQTERDKMKMLEGLEGASASQGASFDRAEMDKILSGLDNRVFVMNNVHDNAPVIFQTRWCLSYLAGPLTRNQIKKLMDPLKLGQSPTPAAGKASAAVAKAAVLGGSANSAPPALSSAIKQLYLPVRGKTEGVSYQPLLYSNMNVRYADVKSKFEETENLSITAAVSDGVISVDWNDAERLDFNVKDLESKAEDGVGFAEVPSDLSDAKNYSEWEKNVVKWAYANLSCSIFYNKKSNQYSKKDEEERDFKLRIQQTSREARDEQIEALRKKYEIKINAAEEKVRKAEQAIEREKDQANSAKMQTAISFGATLLGAFTGGKVASRTNLGRASTAIRGVSRSMQQGGDVKRAEETLDAYKQIIADLEEELTTEIANLEVKLISASDEIESIEIAPKKTDIDVKLVCLLWQPVREDEKGNLEKAW